MKLSAHYNRASIIISVSVLLISGFIYYFTINHIARQQLDADLSEEVAEVITYVNQNHRLPQPIEFDEDLTTFVKTNNTNYETRFFDAPYNNAKENEIEKGRAVSALIKVKGQNYIVTIVESRENTEFLIQIISVITLLLMAVLLTILITTNKYVLNTLWKPFYNVLDQVKKFNITDKHQIEPIVSTVDEFNDLNKAISTMAGRATQDYEGSKAFTENAAHEMMTPLSVIVSKLDVLIQDESLMADQFTQITNIYEAASKLSRLNQSLLLLVKIDNNLLQDTEDLNIKTVVLEKAQQLQEMIRSKKIELDYELDPLHIKASKYLIDVLINNLFSNAIRHNKPGGLIKISAVGNTLSIQNTGAGLALNGDTVFDRFNKSQASDGTGLGLAITKNICTLYHFDINYQYDKGMHCFLVKF